jgi:hypothetical protein
MAKTFSLFLSLLAVAFIFGVTAARGHWLQEKKELAAYEKEMAERPLEALSIARRASALFTDEEKHLYGLAVKQQEKHLPELSLSQAIELAEALEKKLQDTASAYHVRQSWLVARGVGLSQEDVRRLLGLPQKISFQILYGRQLEQWNYERPNRLWLTFACTKNHMPTLQTVRSSSDKGI